MSTVLYAFRAATTAALAEQIDLAKSLASELDGIITDGIEFQVFQTSAGTVFRVNESGYGLKNRLWALPAVFPACNYDDRVEIPEADLENESLAGEIDALIRAEQYVIVSVLDPTPPTAATTMGDGSRQE